MSGILDHLGAAVGHFRCKRPGEIGILAHFGPQRFRRIRLAGRVVIVRAHDEQGRRGNERNLVHHRFAVDHLRRTDKGAQPALIVGRALDVEARIDERRDLVRRDFRRIIGFELLAVAFGGELVLVLEDLSVGIGGTYIR